MVDRETVYLEKAEESLGGAQSELANGRYNNCANRAYSACFQAAVYALMEVGVNPPSKTDRWGHDFVQARFSGDLINRRKRFPAELRSTLEKTYRLRAMADYQLIHVNEAQAVRTVRRADVFVAAVTRAGGRRS